MNVMYNDMKQHFEQNFQLDMIVYLYMMKWEDLVHYHVYYLKVFLNLLEVFVQLDAHGFILQNTCDVFENSLVHTDIITAYDI